MLQCNALLSREGIAFVHVVIHLVIHVEIHLVLRLRMNFAHEHLEHAEKVLFTCAQ